MFSNDAAKPTIALLSILSFFAGPLLCALAVWFSVARRRKPRSLVLAVIPLALTSISIQLTATTLMILYGFGDIAGQRITGVAGVASIFTAADSPLLSRFVEVAVCVGLALMIAPWVGNPKGKGLQPSPMSPLTTIVWSTAALVSVIAVVWLHRDIVELCMLLVDPCRATEATARLGELGTADASAILSMRIAMLEAGTWVVTLCLIGIGFHCLHAERRTKWGVAGSVAVAVAALAWCGMSVSAESKAQSYLDGMGNGFGQGHQIYHAYSRSVIGYVRHPKGRSTLTLHRGPNVQLPASGTSHRFPDADRADAVILTVTRDGQLFVGTETQVDLVTVVDAVKDRLANQLDKTVYVRADASVRYGTIAAVFSQLRAAGVDVVGLLTSRRNPQNNSCATSGLDVLIPEAPLPTASDSARQSQQFQFLAVLRAPATVPMGTGPLDPIVIQVLQGSGGVQWKINQREVSGLNDLTAQLESIFGQRAEKVGFLTAEETVPFSDFVDAVDAGMGAGLDKVAVIVGTPDEATLSQRSAVVAPESTAQNSEGIGYESSPAPTVYHTYSRFGIDNLLKYFREPPPPKSDLIMAPPPPAPPPPPPPPAEPRGGKND